MPAASTRVPVLAQGTISFSQLDKPTRDRFVRNEIVVYTVLVIVAISLVAIVVGAIAITQDQLRFNNQTYRDNADRTNLQITETNLRIDALDRQLQLSTQGKPNAN